MAEALSSSSTRRGSLLGDKETDCQTPRCLRRRSRRCGSWPAEIVTAPGRRSAAGRPAKRGAEAPFSPTEIVGTPVTSLPSKEEKPLSKCADGSAGGDRGSAPHREKGSKVNPPAWFPGGGILRAAFIHAEEDNNNRTKVARPEWTTAPLSPACDRGVSLCWAPSGPTWGGGMRSCRPAVIWRVIGGGGCYPP
ncbi:hypothetical protein MTO96_004686 [Rhipicephalus appendiculatus]